jgi:hypothetical protein
VRRARLSLAVASLTCLVSLLLPSVASARVGAVELRLPGGRLLASLDSQSARYPESGSVLRIGSTAASSSATSRCSPGASGRRR